MDFSSVFWQEKLHYSDWQSSFVFQKFKRTFFRYQWPPLNPLWHKILMVAMMILGSLSILGNGLVVYVFTTTKALRTPSNLYVVNLAFSDFCMMFCMCPAMVVNCYHETWSFGEYTNWSTNSLAHSDMAALAKGRCTSDSSKMYQPHCRIHSFKLELNNVLL